MAQLRRDSRMPRMSEISLVSLDGAPLTKANLTNLSVSGLLVAFIPVEHVEGFSAGQRLRFSFVIPTGGVAGEAEVVRVAASDREVAIRFVQLDGDSRENLNEFLNSIFCGVG